MPRPSPPAPSVPNGGKACDSWAPGLGFHAKKCGLKDDSLTVTIKGYYKVFEVFRSFGREENYQTPVFRACEFGSFRDVALEASGTAVRWDLGGCQNYGPFLGTLNNRCRNIIRTQKGP